MQFSLNSGTRVADAASVKVNVSSRRGELLFLTVGAIAAFLVFAGRAAATTGQLDQSYAPSSASPGGFIEPSQTPAQVFTAGITGQLTDVGIETWLYGSGTPGQPIVLEITTTLNTGAPDPSDVLGTATITGNELTSTPTMITAPVTGNVQVTAGQTYAIIMSSTWSNGGVYYETTTDYSNGYTDGSGWWKFGSGSFSLGSWDWGFETFVQSAPAPSPPAPPAPAPAPVATPEQQESGYCAVAGNTNPQTGQPIPPGTYLDLTDGQPDSDPNYQGATAAFYVEGEGLTCQLPTGDAPNGTWNGYTEYGPGPTTGGPLTPYTILTDSEPTPQDKTTIKYKARKLTARKTSHHG